jgi:DNA-binding response OmpR family regulator
MLTTAQEYKQLLKDIKYQLPRIMLIDDNEALIEELQELLSQSGYRVDSISDSSKAFDMAYNLKPELILLDLKMSPKSGFQVASEIRHCLSMKDIPIIAMTGFFTEKEHILMMKLCGIKAFVLKPFNPVNLITQIEFSLAERKEDERPSGT